MFKVFEFKSNFFIKIELANPSYYLASELQEKYGKSINKIFSYQWLQIRAISHSWGLYIKYLLLDIIKPICILFHSKNLSHLKWIKDQNWFRKQTNENLSSKQSGVL